MKGLSKKFLIMGGGLFIILLIVYTVMRNNKEMFKNKLTKTKKRPKSCPEYAKHYRNGKCYADYDIYGVPCDPSLAVISESDTVLNCKSPMKCFGGGFCGYSASDYDDKTKQLISEQKARDNYDRSSSYSGSKN